jgi:protein SCO1
MKYFMQKFCHSKSMVLTAGMITALFINLAYSHANTLTAGTYKGLLLNPAKQIKTYPLIDHNGKTVAFPESNGKYQLIFFGYTSCPDICPTTLHKIKQIIQSLEEQDRVNFNFVSIDVERDTPAQLKAFVTYFHPKITGFTGNIHDVKAVEKEFGILTRKFQGNSALAYKLEHSVFMYLLDPDGKLLLMYPGSTMPDQIVSDLNLLLSQKHEANNQAN